MPATRGRTLRRLVGPLLPLLLLLLLPGVARAGVVPPDFYGVNIGGGLMGPDIAARPAAFAAMRAGGLTSVRIDASWGGVEPAPPVDGVHTYRWTAYDSLVTDLARNGLRWYPMVGYSAGWASTTTDDPFAPPAGNENFAAFAAALAARYGAGGSFWAEHPELPQLPPITYGIWNEPSNPTFWHGPDATPERYMSLYVASRAAIKAVEPTAVVATAGVLDSGAVNGQAYLQAMLASVLQPRQAVDAIGWHPYVGGVDEILWSVARARKTIDAAGMGTVPIEVSEVGWHTGFSPEERATAARGLAARLPSAGLGVSRLLPYVWSGDPIWQLTDPDGSLGPLGAAYFAGIQDAITKPSPALTAPAPRRKPSATVKRKGPAVPRLTARAPRRMRFVTVKRKGLAVRCTMPRAGRCRVVVKSRGRVLGRASSKLKAGVAGRVTTKPSATRLRAVKGRRSSVQLSVSGPGMAPVALTVQLRR